VVAVDVAGESVLVTSDEQGGLHAAYNVCRHRGAQLRPVTEEPLGQPLACAASSLRCPYHSWTYQGGRDAGQLWSRGPAPARGAAVAGVRCTKANPAQVSTATGDSLVTGTTMTYQVRANYKVLLENYNGCYHCGPVHPELCRLVPAFGGGGGGLPWEDGVPHRDGAWTFTETGTTSRSPLPGLTEQERTRHKGDLVFPNLLVSASADHAAAFVLLPRDVDRTHVVCSLLFAADEVAGDGFDPADAAELWDLVNRQDWAVCESVQRGMSSRSSRHGWFAPMEDDSLDIRRWLLPLLEGRP
jgi:Rieske 2Fe-2S family protein